LRTQKLDSDGKCGMQRRPRPKKKKVRAEEKKSGSKDIRRVDATCRYTRKIKGFSADLNGGRRQMSHGNIGYRRSLRSKKAEEGKQIAY